MTFKCCKKELDKEIIYYPVNSIGNFTNKIGFIEQKDGIIFTSGGDGSISFWNIIVYFLLKDQT